MAIMMNRDWINKCALELSSILVLSFIASCRISSDTAQTNSYLRPPEIYFENTIQNFGTIYQGQKTSKIFSFYNIGDKPLIIEEIKNSCGCTAATSSAPEIMPGGSGEIEVTFDSTGRLGRQSKSIYVYSNDPNEKVSKFTINGFIKTVLHISPSSLSFGYVSEGSTPAKTVLIRPEEGVDILKVESNSKHLFTELEKSESGRDWDLRVTVAENAPMGTIRAKLFVHTTSEQQSIATVAVFARVVGEIAATPEDITFVYSESTQELSFNPQALQVLSISNKPFRITKLDCEPKILFFRHTHNSTSTKYSIVANVRKDYEIRATEGTIYIYTDNPKQEIITVPFTIIMR